MSELTIAIGSFLEEDQVKRIEEHSPARVIYEPDLLPVPRYPCDHTGKPRDLSAAGLQQWRSLGATADVFFDFDWHEPATMPERCPRLRWIQATSAGIGGFMQRTGLDASGLTVTTAAGIHAVPLSEFAIMGALHFVKGVPQLRERQRARHWELYTTRQLAGLRVLVVGLGGIGRTVARSFAALGVDVWGLGRDGKSYQVPGVSRVIYRADLDDALAQIDVLVLACPLTADTEGMIGAAQIGQLKPDAVVVNIARGPVIDQAALTAALRDGRLAGACLDVFAVEPLPSDDPLWGLDNVILSPHSASTVVTENAALVDLFLANLDRFSSATPMRNLYDPARGY
jgi:glyoxylate/hydroxypyruvate reductase